MRHFHSYLIILFMNDRIRSAIYSFQLRLTTDYDSLIHLGTILCIIVSCFFPEKFSVRKASHRGHT